MTSDFIHVVPAVGQLKWIVIGLDGAWAEIFPTLATAIARAASQARIETSIGSRAIGVRSRDLQGFWQDETSERVAALDPSQRPPFVLPEPLVKKAV
jgi:hypothetical protein